MSTPRSGFRLIGRVVKAFGIRGEMVVQLPTNSHQPFESLKRVFIGATEKTLQQMKVVSVAIGRTGIRLRVNEVQGRTEAERLVGQMAYIEGNERARLPRGTYYVGDIVGMQVIDQDGNTVGIVREVLHMPASDVYVIDAHGREVMVPAVKEFIREIDLKARVVRMHLIEGMVGE